MVCRNCFLVELARDGFAWILYHSVLGCVAASHCKFNSGLGVIHKTVIDICKYVIFRRAWRRYKGPNLKRDCPIYDGKRLGLICGKGMNKERKCGGFVFIWKASYHCIIIQLKVRTLDGELVAMLAVDNLCTLCLNLVFLTILFFFFSQLLRKRVITCSFIYRRHIIHSFAFINIYFLLLPHLTPHMFF